MTRMIKRTLVQHEELIESGMKGFLDVGSSLIAIRDEKLYADQYDTFEAYCLKRWGFAKSRAYQFIDATETVSNLSTIVDTETQKTGGKCEIPLPNNEAQARAVSEASDDPKKQARVWKAAVAKAESNGKPVTAATVKAVAAELLGPKQPAREPGEDPVEPEHVEPPKVVATPFDEPLAGVDFVLKVAVPKMQEFAILAERALGSGKGDFSASKIGKLAATIHGEFESIRGVLKNAQTKAAKAK